MLFVKDLKIGKKMFLGFGIIILIMLTVIGNSYVNFVKESEAVAWNVHTYKTIEESDNVLISLVNMETGARGYVITGNESFLEPFNQGKDSYKQHYNKLKELTVDNPDQQQRLIRFQSQYEEWLEWEKTKIIANRQQVSLGESKLEDLISIVQSGEGKEMFDNLRSILGEINNEEVQLLQNRNIDLVKMEKETRAVMLIGAILATIAAIVIASLVIRMIVNPVQIVTKTFKGIAKGDVNLEVRLNINSNDELGNMAKYFNIFMSKLKELIVENKNQGWLSKGRAELSEEIRGIQEINSLSLNIISYICRYLDAQVGTLYINTDENTFKLLGSYAYNINKDLPNEFRIGEGLAGQAALEKQTILVKDIPNDYMKIDFGIGEAIPKNVLIAPCIYHGEVECIIEIGSFNEFTDVQLKFIEQISENIAISINSTKAQTKMEELLDKTLVQSEELQVQQEELRQNNEELEQQANVLRQSEMSLQTQQEELISSNEELEEKTRKLEIQKSDIIKNNERLRKANFEIEEKAKELEIASKYKSEFLANMSHELRTPLNSILVLSQLLENKKDNNVLTEKQREYAKTIHSSGKNLLMLINDILDLSKVEAGKMDINFEKINLVELVEDIERLFSPIAAQKKLDFKIEIEKGLPEEIISDRQRLEQIVNNLLANAFKFTSKGSVAIKICKPKENDIKHFDVKGDINKLISIEVTDTGIGIEEEKQKLIFEAFKQVDGTISRKYGGTGLGLSISTELAHLLGGTIYLKSQQGVGSTFTLAVLNNDINVIELVKLNNNIDVVELVKSNKEDDGCEDKSLDDKPTDTYNDSNNIEGNVLKDFKKILIIDQNKEQTKIIYDSLSEREFQVTALESGLESYKLLEIEQFDCMILDLNLKDMNGLELLNRLKDENKINFPILIHTKDNITQEDEEKLNRYTESIIIKGKSSIERLLDEVSLFFHSVDLNIDDKKIKNIKSSHEKENSLINKKILIVDDDMRNVFSLTSALEEKGIKVIVGRNGEEGIQKLQENLDTDLIIMDVMMPEMDGYTAMKEIRKEKQFKNTPIIAITAKAMKDDRQKCIESGADDYLTKPVDISKLISLLRVWLYK